MRVLGAGLALAAILLLPLIALNLAAFGDVHLKRFREPTLVLFAGIALVALARSNPLSGARRLAQGARRVLNRPDFFPWMAGIMLGLYLLAAATFFMAFRLGGHDLSLMDEAIHNSYGGKWMHAGPFGRSLWSEHFYAILAFLIPVHAAFPSPWVSVLAQPLLLWASVLVLRALLADCRLSRPVVNLACLAFLNNPVTITSLTSILHPETFLPLALFSMVLAYRRRRWTWYWTALAVALLIKEDVGLYLLGWAAYVAVACRRPALGAATAAVCLAWFGMVLGVFMPGLGGPERYKFIDRWGQWGATPLAILGGMASRPHEVFALMLGKRPILMFAGLLMLPFATRWGWLLFVLPWAVNCTGNEPQQAQLNLYYGIPVLAFASVAAVEALRAPNIRRALRGRIAPLLATAALILNVGHFTFPRIPPERPRILAALAGLPRDASIQVMNCFYPELDYGTDKAVLWIDRPWTADYVVASKDPALRWPFSRGEIDRLAAQAEGGGGYEDVSTVHSLYVLRRKPPGGP